MQSKASAKSTRGRVQTCAELCSGHTRSRGSSGGAAGLPDATVAQFTAGSVSKEQFVEILIDHIYPAELAEVVSLSTSTGRPQLDEGDQETTTVTTSRSSRRQV